jgi:hypothetical protein
VAPRPHVSLATDWSRGRLLIVPTHISRWDLDKTYLRTEFDTLRDLVRTAFERPDEKRTNPGAATLLREMVRADVAIHILSGSPEQMRRRLEDKLRLDGVTWESFTLKPNLKNLLRFRFRALRDQLGYKLPSLLASRVSLPETSVALKETLFGDDAEADAFVYSLYADIVEGKVGEDIVLTVCERGRQYEDVTANILRFTRMVQKVPAVERIFIHLEKQTAPADFTPYGMRVVPFYNYMQTAFVLFEDGRLPALGVLRVAIEFIVGFRFDGDALARSYLDLAKRGHLSGRRVDEIAGALAEWSDREQVPCKEELDRLVHRLPEHAALAAERYQAPAQAAPAYVDIVKRHNPRAHRR